MGALDDYPMHFEDIADKNKLRKKDLRMEKSKVTTKKSVKGTDTKVEKGKKTLSIYTYMNWKQFGIAGRFENGIKLTFLWFETHITFEKR